MIVNKVDSIKETEDMLFFTVHYTTPSFIFFKKEYSEEYFIMKSNGGYKTWIKKYPSNGTWFFAKEWECVSAFANKNDIEELKKHLNV